MRPHFGLFHFRCLLLTLSLMIFCICVNSSTVSAQNFGEMVRSSEPLTPEEELQTFRVPSGFEVQLFASEPEIQKPMNMAFDAQGRLWVSGSNDYPFPNLTSSATDSIRILEDTTGDGRANKVTTFVDGITIPIGLYPYQDGVIAFSIPNIVFYRDTNGDGTADQREILYGPFDFSRDTHGLNNAFRRGLDGWMYACHGFNNHSTVAGKDGHSVTMHSGNTYRFKVDGSRIEHVTHGQVNPFGMTFDHLGDLYSSDCHTKPVTLLLRGGYYPSFGRPDDGLGFVPAVMNHLHGSTAIAGISQYTGQRFPQEYENSLFVGNVMTSRVHRDIIEYTGSTVKVVEQPDFLTSTDSWFRPVDIQCGPDQALYIADFYNRIIGHYEVPLDHPGRDRSRARIWRVKYVGDKSQNSEAPAKNLTRLSAKELVQSLAHPSLPANYRSVEQLVERLGKSAVPEIRQALLNPKTPQQYAYLLWALHRLGELTLSDLQTAHSSQQETVQIHVQRILADVTDLSSEQLELVLAGLQGPPLVARAAATTLEQHPNLASIRPLIQTSVTVSKEDVHLQHACKMALRNALYLPGAYGFIAQTNWSEFERTLLLQISLAVKSEASAQYLLNQLDQVEISQSQLQQILTLAARQLQIRDLPRLIELARTRFAGNVDLQLELFQSLLTGLQQQGRKPTLELILWGDELVAVVLETPTPGLTDWIALGANGGVPISWELEPRNTADGQQGKLFLSSLPAGERAVGVLKSRSFPLPESLSFYVCGHLGFPDRPAILKNSVSLFVEGQAEPLHTVYAPRNDTAQKIVWDLQKQQGQTGYLQVTDDIDIQSYAWIAISGIEPEVLKIPQLSPLTIQGRYLAATRIAGQLGLNNFQPRFTEVALSEAQSLAVRFEALKLLNAKSEQPVTRGLLALFQEQSLHSEQRNTIARLITQYRDETFRELVKTFPLSLQTVFARSMTQFEAGAVQLLEFLEAGAISPSVLQSPSVSAQIIALTNESLKQKYQSLQSTLPDVNTQHLELLAARRQEFQREAASVTEGQAVFKKNCAACHSVGGEGKKVGPQLDGIGNRGLDRLLEDILTPNRNIDIAFRSHIYLLEDGKVYSGLLRREEGELTVIANQKGEETSFPSKQVEAAKVSAISIMPENFGDLISPADFNHLLGYLLEQRQQPNTP